MEWRRQMGCDGNGMEETDGQWILRVLKWRGRVNHL
jgi:hypothetical protein